MPMTALVCLALFLIQAPQTAPKPASIEGFVRRVGTGEPVFKARITLSGSLEPVNGAIPPNGVQKTITTDKYGHFVFTDLQAGRYSLQATANSFVRMGYGQKAQNLPSTPILLTAGQRVQDIVFEMIPTGTISGRIYDFDNMPMPSADVVLQKLAYDANGQKTLQVIQQGRTNDLGEYRLFWITPGKYFLRAEYTGAPSPMSRNPNEYIGAPEEGYAPTYYPGTSDASSASEIELLPGAQISAIDLSLMKTKTYTVRGRAIVNAPNAATTRPFVSIRPRQQVAPIMTGMNTTMNADGTFEIRNVLPGPYVLQANAGGSLGLRAERPLDVNDDMEGVVITLSPGFDVPFRMTFEGTPPATLPNMRPMLRTMGDASGASFMATMNNQTIIKVDGVFNIPNVIPGIYQLQLLPMPGPDYYVKAISFGRTDALRDGIAVDHTPETPIEVLLSPNAGSIKGTVIDKDGKPLPSTRVFLIPADRTRTERFRSAATDPTGNFTMRGIVPGNYKLFAWDLIEPNAERDPDFVRRYEEQGKAAPIAEGTNPNVELRLIKVAP